MSDIAKWALLAAAAIAAKTPKNLKNFFIELTLLNFLKIYLLLL